MTAPGFTLFGTAIGHCAIAWSERGIIGVQLPGSHANATRARMRRRFPRACDAPPPPDIEHAIEGIVALLRGEPRTLQSLALDMEDVLPFDRRVYEVARTILPGATLTYGEVAARLGEPDTAREVGRALGQNPFALVVPCHRVVAAAGKPGGFSVRGGVALKLRLLSIEAGQVELTTM